MARLARKLTPGEIAMASQLFGGAIDYACVRVHNRRTCHACSRRTAR